MLLWSGQPASWVGTEVSGIALPLVVLALTGSPVQAGGGAAIRGLIYVLVVAQYSLSLLGRSQVG